MSGIVMNYYEKGIKQGLEQGITEGKAAGIAEGKAAERKYLRQKMVMAGIPEEQIEAVFAQ